MSFTTIGSIINELVPIVFSIAGFVLLIYLVIGGVQLMLTQGEPKAVQAAKGKITGAIVGFIVVFLAYWLVILIGKILGIEAIQSIFG